MTSRFDSNSRARFAIAALVACALFAGVSMAVAQQDAASEKMAAIKQSLQSSMAALKSYEWVETATVKLDGEQKSRKQNRCYYGADGKQQKVPLDGQSQESGKKPRGVRGRIAKKKTADMEDYIQSAMGLIKQYIPPDPQKLQAMQEAGTQKLEVLDGASRIRAVFPSYLKKGDVLSVDIDPNNDRILGIEVSSYIDDDPKDAVTLDVTFSTIQDGTVYPAKTVLHGESKKLDILIENSGYHKTGS